MEVNKWSLVSAYPGVWWPWQAAVSQGGPPRWFCRKDRTLHEQWAAKNPKNRWNDYLKYGIDYRSMDIWKSITKLFSEQEFKIFPLINVQQLLGLIAITVIL